MNKFIDGFMDDVQKAINDVSREDISKVFNILQATYERDGRIYIFGNGGSLAMATHWVSDFNKTVFSHHLDSNSKRFQAIRIPTTDSEITAWANDVGFDMVFAGPLKNYLQDSDTVIAISSSGNSPNVVKGAEMAKGLNIPVISLTGFDGGKLKEISDVCIHVKTDLGSYEIVEGVHGVILHMIIKYFKDYFDYLVSRDTKETKVKSPFRLEFLGGSTDLKNYYSLYEGRVLNVTINKYIYVRLKKSEDGNFKIIANGNTQITNKVEEINSDLIKESFKYFNITEPVELEINSDIHGKGSGLGSSSSLTAALTKSISVYKGKNLSKREIAEESCHIEIDLAGAPIGKQDQYATVFGGLNLYRFKQDGYVDVEDLKLSDEFLSKLNKHILLFDTGSSHSSSEILKKQNTSFEKNLPILRKMADLVLDGVEALKNEEIKKFAKVLFEEWNIKKDLTKGIVNQDIEKLYKKAIKAGAWGGRVSGAGGGGFMLLIVPLIRQKSVRKALKDYKELDFDFTTDGTALIN